MEEGDILDATSTMHNLSEAIWGRVFQLERVYFLCVTLTRCLPKPFEESTRQQGLDTDIEMTRIAGGIVCIE